MFPAFWLTVRIGNKQAKKILIPLLLPFVLIFILAVEILAVIPLIIVAKKKDKPILLKIAGRFYFSRLILAIIFYGRPFRVNVNDGTNKVLVTGKLIAKSESLYTSPNTNIVLN